MAMAEARMEAPLLAGQVPSPCRPGRSLSSASNGSLVNAFAIGQRLEEELESVFSSIQQNTCRGSQSTEDLFAEDEKNRQYAAAGPLKRAFPERYAALLVTLAVEVPVALIISGGSKDLRRLIGVERYTLLLAFLPLTSAISGNVGLQASTLTTRAISHGDCTKATYLRWLRAELLTAALLSVVTGLAVALLALLWTHATFEEGWDVGFAITVGLSQAFSIAIAGLTGTCAPLIFTFIFHGDAGKWAGPMETAVQDVAGSFAMVYVAQWVLLQCIRLGLSPAVVKV